MDKEGNDTATFWEHLDELRRVIIRILIVTGVFAIVAFCLKDLLFAVVLAPHSSDFFTYRILGVESFRIHLMNTGLTEQFMIHMRMAVFAGLLMASPYIIYQLFRFMAPALYEKERHITIWVVGSGYAMFILGIVINYLIIFPLTVRFLGTYQVSTDVENMLTLQSYVDTLLGLGLAIGVVFELPVVSGLLACMGLLTATTMLHYRRHAIVLILIVAAIITPTTDAFTLFIVALPIWMLFEVSIWIAWAVEPK
ncbi:MAG: twin-arginine translocase subunit TatC [Prevotella sp.]|nr:twin-arginine translocase subunit TatC [Prevotella sp.]